MKKMVIVINGKGGVGKDTLVCALASYYSLMNISAIDPIKEIASKYGWNGEKDNKSRKFLSDLKRAFSNYNNLPNNYLLEQYKIFCENDKELLVVHIREPDQIKLFLKSVSIPHISILVTRDDINGLDNYGNYSDDNVNNYKYNYYFNNNLPIQISVSNFVSLIESALCLIYN